MRSPAASAPSRLTQAARKPEAGEADAGVAFRAGVIDEQGRRVAD